MSTLQLLNSKGTKNLDIVQWSETAY